MGSTFRVVCNMGRVPIDLATRPEKSRPAWVALVSEKCRNWNNRTAKREQSPGNILCERGSLIS